MRNRLRQLPLATPEGLPPRMPTEVEPSICYACGASSLLSFSSCPNFECDCYGVHAQDNCRNCGRSFDATPRGYLIGGGASTHTWVIVPRAYRQTGTRYGLEDHYVYECERCGNIAGASVRTWPDGHAPTLRYSFGYHSACSRVPHTEPLVRNRHQWLQVIGRGTCRCYYCGLEVDEPHLASYNSTFCDRSSGRSMNQTPPGGASMEYHPNTSIRFQVKKHVEDPEVRRPSRFEREDPI